MSFWPMLIHVIQQCKEDLRGSLRVPKHFCIKTLLTLTSLSSLHSGLFSSLPCARSLYENMQYNYILVPRSTLAFERGLYMACYFGKNHFPKTALWPSEAKTDSLFSLTLHWHSMMSAHPTCGLKYSKPMVLVFSFLFCFKWHHGFHQLPSLA